MNAGIATTTTHAPSVNLVIRKITVAAAVTSAPKPLTAARICQRGALVRHQCTTSPLCASVKPMNTPMANSGIIVLVLPFTTTSSTPDRTASAQMPLANTCRSPRSENRCGR
jgi:hypothetical protein